MGAKGEVCNTVCGRKGLVCNGDKGTKLTTNALVGAAFKEAGYTCKGYHGPRDYAGTPFSTGRTDDCAPFIASSKAKSSCTANNAQTHAPLCYCERKGQHIMRKHHVVLLHRLVPFERCDRS